MGSSNVHNEHSLTTRIPNPFDDQVEFGEADDQNIMMDVGTGVGGGETMNGRESGGSLRRFGNAKRNDKVGISESLGGSLDYQVLVINSQGKESNKMRNSLEMINNRSSASRNHLNYYDTSNSVAKHTSTLNDSPGLKIDQGIL